MKYFIVLTLVIFFSESVKPQQDLFYLIDTKIQANDFNIYIDFEKLDSIKQLEIIEFVRKYNSIYTYEQMITARLFVGNTFHRSQYVTVKQNAVNYLLDLHRCFQSTTYWSKFDKQSYYNSEANAKILKIIREEPLDSFEFSMHMHKMTESANNYWDRLTNRINAISKKENKSFEYVKDSLVNEYLNITLKHLTPDVFVDDYIILLAGWLDLKEVIPYLNSNIQRKKIGQKGKNSVLANEIALAKLGETGLQDYFIQKWRRELNNPESFKSYTYNKSLILNQIIYIGCQECIYFFIEGLKSSNLYYEPSVTEDNYYPINRLYLDYISNYIINFPYNYGEYSYWKKTEVSQDGLNKAILWLEENKGKYELDSEKFVWPLD